MWGDDEAPLPPNAQIAPSGRSTAGENFMAMLDSVFHNDTTTAPLYQTLEAYELEIKRFEEETGVPIGIVDPDDLPGYHPSAESGAISALSYATAARMYYDGKFDEIRKSRPDLADRVPSRQSIMETVSREAQRRDQRAAEVSAMADWKGRASGFAGGMTGAMADPVNQATLPLGGPSKTVLGAAAKGAAVNAGVEAAIQPFVQSRRMDIGLDGGFAQGAQNVLFAGAGGAVLGGGFKGAEIGVNRGAKYLQDNYFSSRDIARAFSDMVDSTDLSSGAPMSRADMIARYDAGEPSPAGDAARAALQADLDIDLKNPMGDSVPARVQHREAVAAMEAGRPLPKLTAPVDKVDLPNQLEVFNPEDLNVDAKRFQFKSGGDKEGVTDRLTDVTEWDPIKADNLMVWRDMDGKAWVADGHQRSALARRLKAKNPDADIRLTATVLDERAGITAEQARAIAAGKNLAQGTGTAVDVAKVLRADPDLLDGTISRHAANVRQGQDLLRLNDDAFMMVVNDLVPENYAAIVGRIVPDELQEDILGLLFRTSPDNAFQAESIIRQAMAAPVRQEVTEDLFGAVETARSLYVERAKVLDAAVKRLKKDRAVFETLVREEGRITAEGNQLDKSRNKGRAQDDAEAAEILTKLANRKGEISDWLGAAAGKLADGDSLAKVTSEFVDRVRGRSGSSGAADGGGGSGAARSAPQDRSAQDGPAESAGPADAAIERAGSVETADLQKAAEDIEFSLFGDDAPRVAEIPLAERLDGTDRVADVKSPDEIDADLQADEDMLNRLRGCVRE